MDRRTDRKKPLTRAGSASPAGFGGPADNREGRYCIPCAVSNPGFRERAPLACSAPFDETQPRAWIEGRAYRLRLNLAPAAPCVRCGGEPPVAYCPEEPDTLAA